MHDPRVDVFANGAVRLGSRVVCDGFAEGYPFRVQTHIHDDHMGQFARSKGEQDLLLTPETHELLTRIIQEGSDHGRKTRASAWYKWLAHRHLPTTEALT